MGIDRIDEIQRFPIWEDSCFHLIHDVRKGESGLGIGKGVAATGPGLTKGARRGTEDCAQFFPCFRERILHEPGGEGGW